MYMEEAEKKGFFFTGITWRTWDKEREEKEKARLKVLKAKYKGLDYRIVTGKASSWLSIGSKAVMGNKTFNLVQYYNEEQQKKYIDNYANRLADLERDYLEKLHKLQDEQQKAVEKYELIQSITVG